MRELSGELGHALALPCKAKATAHTGTRAHRVTVAVKTNTVGLLPQCV